MKLHRNMSGLVLGAVAGSRANAFADDIAWVRGISDNLGAPPGRVFLRVLLMTVAPLVSATIAFGVAGMGDIRWVGLVGGKTLGYFPFSTDLAVVIGLVPVNASEPGRGVDPGMRAELLASYESHGSDPRGTHDLGVNTFVAVVPRNPFRAAVKIDVRDGAVGVAPEGLGIILGVDRLLDARRTTVNITGDLTTAAFVARSERARERRALAEAARSPTSS